MWRDRPPEVAASGGRILSPRYQAAAALGHGVGCREDRAGADNACGHGDPEGYLPQVLINDFGHFVVLPSLPDRFST
jgi:hypothetical protein